MTTHGSVMTNTTKNKKGDTNEARLNQTTSSFASQSIIQQNRYIKEYVNKQYSNSGITDALRQA